MVKSIGLSGTRFVAIVLKLTARRPDASFTFAPENICASLDDTQPVFPMTLQPIQLGTSRLEGLPFMAVGMEQRQKPLELDPAWAGSFVTEGTMSPFGHTPQTQRAHGFVKALGAGVGNLPALVLSPRTVYRLAFAEGGTAWVGLIYEMGRHRIAEIYVLGRKIDLPPLPTIDSGSAPSPSAEAQPERWTFARAEAQPERWTFAKIFSMPALPGYARMNGTSNENVYVSSSGATVSIAAVQLNSGAADEKVTRGTEVLKFQFEEFADQAVRDFAGKVAKPFSTRQLASGGAVAALPVEAQSNSNPRYALQYGAVSRSGLIVVILVRGVGPAVDAVASFDPIFQSAQFSE